MASAQTNSTPVSTAALIGVARGGRSAAWSLQLLGVVASGFGAYLHFHFQAGMQEVERGAPNVAGTFIVARQAELSATGAALFLAGITFLFIGVAFRWLAIVASAHVAGRSGPVHSAGAPQDTSEMKGV